MSARSSSDSSRRRLAGAVDAAVAAARSVAADRRPDARERTAALPALPGGLPPARSIG